MANVERKESTGTVWTSVQAYSMAIICLALGLALGYLFRGSQPGEAASAAAPATTASTPSQMPPPPGTAAPQKLTPEMLAELSKPLEDKLKENPSDFDTIVKLGNIYYDNQSYPKAIEIYERALKLKPDNADVLTDVGTAYWYTGSTDKALTLFEKALKSDPKHAGTLFNMGVVMWQGKQDPKGAVEAWERLLKSNPDYPQRQQVEELIGRAKMHSKAS